MIEIGSFIADRYEILEKIGAGGMSDVYKAKDQVLGRFVAVKILKPEFAEDVNFVTKFHTEAQSAAGLQHPNIVNIYDVRGVPGNGGCYDVQKEAFEDGADLLIATTSSDEINILACMVAKKIGTQHTIARIRNPEYEQQLHFMRDELGLSMIVNPEKTTAREMARVLRFPSAIKREQFCR